MTNNFEWPPEGKEIIVSLRESNGEHGLYPCIYMGMGIFKFLQNGEQYACEVKEKALTSKTKKNFITIKKKIKKDALYILGKEVISWWIPKKGDSK